MSLKLPTFQSGRPLLEQVTADKLNQIVDAIRQCELSGGVGYDVNKGPGGATLTIRQQGNQYIPASGSPILKIVGLSNSGMSHTDASVVVNPGVESYNFFSKTPTGSYSTAYVHGLTRSSFITYNTENNYGKIAIERKRTFVQASNVLSSADLYRRIGLTSFQGEVFTASSFDVSTFSSQCDAITSGEYVFDETSSFFPRLIGTCGATAYALGIAAQQQTYRQWGAGTGSGQIACSGTTYIVVSTCTGRSATRYYTFSSSGNADGSFGDNSETIPNGNYSFKRIFDLGDLSSTNVKIRAKIRIASGTGAFVSVKLNGQNATYSSFEPQTSTFIPIEITDGFIAGQNELEFIISSSSSTIYPSVSFEFLPSSVVISAATGFASLTDAQKDLIGYGTPVQVNSVPTASLHAYNGSGDKGVTASYTFLRNV